MSLRKMLGFEKPAERAKRIEVVQEEVTKQTCPHDKILVHTSSKTLIGERIVIATCTACAKSLQFNLGTVYEDSLSEVTKVVLEAKGYRNTEKRLWERTNNEESS